MTASLTVPDSNSPAPEPVAGGRKGKNEQALRTLQQLCDTLQPGDRLPLHTELMRRYGLPERAVLRALDELQRHGRIVRRPGAGTFVAEPAGVGGSDVSAPAGMLDSRTIVAVRVPDSSFFDHCVDLLFRHTDAAGLSLICKIVGTETVPDLTLPAGAELPPGFVLFRYDLAPLAKQILQRGGRAVIVGAPPADVIPEAPCVYGDHVRGGYLATRHLIDLGHRRIALCAGTADLQRTLRWRGDQRALQEAERAGTPVTVSLLPERETAAWRDDPARAAAYFARPDAPTAVVAWNDDGAIRLIIALQRAGLRVPDDVSVVGYDNLPASEKIFPRLTTVDHAVDWQLSTALDLVKPTAALPSPTHTMAVTPTLVPRESSAPPGQRHVP